jgi:hypothetical protein
LQLLKEGILGVLVYIIILGFIDILAVPGFLCPEEEGVVVAGAPVALAGAFVVGAAAVVLLLVPFILLYNYSNILLSS